MILRYGTREDQAALKSEAARALLTSCIDDPWRDATWKTVGLPLASHEVPARVTADFHPHEAFYDRLHRLNDRNGYPKDCRIVAIANSSRLGPATCRDLLHLWLPWTYEWTLKASPDDRAPGSLLPPLYVGRFVTSVPFGIAGAYLRDAPTFLPAESALDAGPDEKPPFDAFYERPANLPPLSHDRPDPGALRFAVQEILASDWRCVLLALTRVGYFAGERAAGKCRPMNLPGASSGVSYRPSTRTSADLHAAACSLAPPLVPSTAPCSLARPLVP